MNNFGKIKSKLLKKLTEAYASDNFKQNTKNLIKVVKKNKDFKEMYLFYEEIENKYIEDKEVAKLYVEQLGSLLKEKDPAQILVADVCGLATIYMKEKDGETTPMQNFYKEYFRPYFLKNIRLACSTNNWNSEKVKKFYDQLVKSQDIYTLTMLQEFDETKHVAAGTTTFIPPADAVNSTAPVDNDY
jgi:hypothetical protein